jgi:hypothetical protein
VVPVADKLAVIHIDQIRIAEDFFVVCFSYSLYAVGTEVFVEKEEAALFVEVHLIDHLYGHVGGSHVDCR